MSCEFCGSPNHASFDCSKRAGRPVATPEAPKVQVFEDKPRWPGAPRICALANLPAFMDRAEAMDFHERVGPGNHVLKVWECQHCGQVHYSIRPRAPTGESSGSGRDSVIPESVQRSLARPRKGSRAAQDPQGLLPPRPEGEKLTKPKPSAPPHPPRRSSYQRGLL